MGDADTERICAVRIDVNRDGIFLVSINVHGRDKWDSWHQTLDEAKHEAQKTYGIPLDGWERVSRL